MGNITSVRVVLVAALSVAVAVSGPTAASAKADLTCTIAVTPNPENQTVTVQREVLNQGDEDAVPKNQEFAAFMVWLNLDHPPTIKDSGAVIEEKGVSIVSNGGKAPPITLEEHDVGAMGFGKFEAWGLVNPDYGGPMFNVYDEDVTDNNGCKVKWEMTEPVKAPDLEILTFVSAPWDPPEPGKATFAGSVVNTGNADAQIAPFIDIC